MGGRKNDELSLRWLQFGVFSSIMRLHSTNNLFNGKEPWNYSEPFATIMKRFLRLRHQLIPYLYTANYQCASEGVPLIEPIYYEHDEPGAYLYPNEYYFGPALLVHPVVSPLHTEVQASRTDSYLPEGIYFDFFTGVCYRGGKKVSFFRNYSGIPVLAKAGAILPMNGDEYSGNGVDLPLRLLVKVFAGADGSFVMYEDDGETMEYEKGKYALTKMQLDWQKGVLSLQQNDSFALLPPNRSVTIELNGLDTESCGVPCCYSGSDPVKISYETNPAEGKMCIVIPSGIDLRDFRLEFGVACKIHKNDMLALAYERIRRAYIPYEQKETLYNILCSFSPREAADQLAHEDISENLLLLLLEVLNAA